MKRIQAAQIRWLTEAQVEMKLRLGMKGAVCSLYDSLTQNVGSESQYVGYINPVTESYIPDNRRLTLTTHQATSLFDTLVEKVPTGKAFQVLPTTKYYGTNVEVHAWGACYGDLVYIFRFSCREGVPLQVWCIQEESLDINIQEDPVISYVLGLPYVP